MIRNCNFAHEICCWHHRNDVILYCWSADRISAFSTYHTAKHTHMEQCQFGIIPQTGIKQRPSIISSRNVCVAIVVHSFIASIADEIIPLAGVLWSNTYRCVRWSVYGWYNIRVQRAVCTNGNAIIQNESVHKFIEGVQQYDAYGMCNLCASTCNAWHMYNIIPTYLN